MIFMGKCLQLAGMGMVIVGLGVGILREHGMKAEFQCLALGVLIFWSGRMIGGAHKDA